MMLFDLATQVKPDLSDAGHGAISLNGGGSGPGTWARCSGCSSERGTIDENLSGLVNVIITTFDGDVSSCICVFDHKLSCWKDADHSNKTASMSSDVKQTQKEQECPTLRSHYV